jgi:PKD repeat protein
MKTSMLLVSICILTLVTTTGFGSGISQIKKEGTVGSQMDQMNYGPGDGIIAEYTWEYLGGNQVTFTDASTGGSGPVQYAWDFTNDGTDDAWGSTVTHTYSGSGPYYCDHWVRGDDDTQSQVLKPVRPSSGGSADFTYVIDGLCVTFTDTSTGGGGVNQMAWDFTDDGTDDAWVSPVTHCYPSAGTYSVDHWVRFNDDSQDTILQQVTVTDEGITAGFTWTVSGYTITFTDTSTGGGGVANSAWDFTSDGTDDAWGLVVSHTYPDSSTYVVTHWVQGNDGSQDQCSINVRKVTVDTFEKTREINLRFWEIILERFPHTFPILRHLMEY